MYIPNLPDEVPRRGNALTRGIGRLVLRLMGWRFLGNFPPQAKFVGIAAPHTSNWDFVIGIAAVLATGVEARWLGKHTLFKPPFGWFMRALGGIPVERHAPVGVVDQSVAAFRKREALFLGLSPEGTRKKTERWKTGFYRIATAADVPIVLGHFDFEHKRVGVLLTLHPTGDFAHDMALINAYYSAVVPKYPEQFSPSEVTLLPAA